MRIATLALAATLAAPTAGLACGGLFCDNSQPVNQAAERILFAREGETMHMIVRLTYDGPPVEFGWLLPAPADVETTVSSEALFQFFDQQYAPVFQLRTEIHPDCVALQNRGNPDSSAPAFEGGAGGAGGGGGGPDVQVLSREAVGPYDRTILQAATVEDLTTWLRDNQYQFPEGSEDRLRPYVELGSAFVALKLLPGAESDDVIPLHLTFTSDSPAIPLRPTAVAAEPDMGIIVHLLGGSRAVPSNFLHVTPNPAAIDWLANGSNYPDVVAAAADEADGHAFATDYAGPAQDPGLRTVPDEILTALEGAETLADVRVEVDLFSLDADWQRVIRGSITTEDPSPSDVLSCPGCYDLADIPVDGQALAMRIRTEIVAPREQIAAMFEAHGYLTRLYTLMSAADMDRDPIFAFNPDLDGVDRTRQAVRHVGCDGEGTLDFDNSVVALPDGQQVQLVNGQMPGVIQRQAGETVRGAETQAAALTERTFAAGQSEVVGELANPSQDPLPGAPSGDGGCGCDVGDSAPTPLAFLALLGLFTLRRRRR